MRLKLLPITLVVLAVACQKDDIGTSYKENTEEARYQLVPGTYLEGAVRIKFREGADNYAPTVNTRGGVESGLEELDQAIVTVGGHSAKRTFPYGGKYEQRRRKAGLHLWYDVYFDDKVPVSRALGEFSRIGEIAHVEAIYLGEPIREPYDTASDLPVKLFTADRTNVFPFDDPMFEEQWHYNNTGITPLHVEGSDINLLEAWKVTRGHPDVIVAINDTGIQWDHPDLADNIWINYAELNGRPGVDDDNNGYIDDVHGFNFHTGTAVYSPESHGTHVAGTVGAVNNNALGVCGVAGGSGNGDGIKLMDCDYMYGGFWTLDPDMFTYAADNGAVISCNSWGFVYDKHILPQVWKEAMDYFIDYAGTDETGTYQVGPMKGGVIVFASGNDYRNWASYPSQYERCLAVSSLGPDYVKATYSNWDVGVDLSAPGGQAPHSVVSTDINSDYSGKQGTSMACPHVAGIAALIVSAYGTQGPGLTNDAVRNIILSSCRDIDSYNPEHAGMLGAGLIDAGKALNLNSGTAPGPITGLAADVEFNNIKVSLPVHTDANGLPLGSYELFLSKREITAGELGSPPSDILKITLPPTSNGVEYTFANLDFATIYYIAVRGFDYFGNNTGLTRTTAMTYSIISPVFSKIPDLYIGSVGAKLSYDLRSYLNLDDYPAGQVTISTSTSGPDNVTCSINGDNLLNITSRSLGLSVITLKARVTYSGEVASTSFRIMVRDDKQAVDLYPNPVTDILNIRMGQDVNGQVSTSLINSGGQRVMEREVNVSPFSPGQLDMGKLSSGTYTLLIRYGPYELRRTISKK